MPVESRRKTFPSLIVLVALLGGFLVVARAAPASADLASLKGACTQKDAVDNDTANGTTLPYTFCDDGVPPTGGTEPNEGAVSAVPVPAKYKGYIGLPAKASDAATMPGADSNGDIALDVDVSLPDPTLNPPPSKGYPLIVLMHGCCAGNKTGWEAQTIDTGGEKWHYSNAWFAARGYVVLTYTARGFVNGQNRGSTGETQLDSRLFEINDYQHLAGLLADDPFFNVNPRRVVVSGGSYGGGFSWLAMTDPDWKSPGGKVMRLAAAAPKYGWTDLVYSLVPTGTHKRDALPATDGSDSHSPLGFPKKSIVAALYASGKTGIPPGGNHTTFPEYIDEGAACLESTDPYESNPVCARTIEETLPSFINDRSAYYQNRFFLRLARGLTRPVPVFSASTFTDPLFTPVENRRMVERLKRTLRGYPVQEDYGDYQHFVQNKAKEWGDVCGNDRHVCRYSDYPNGNLNAAPTDRKRLGVTTRLNRFIDHYAKPPGNPSAPKPGFNVRASLQICPENASASYPADEPGPRFVASSFGRLARNTLSVVATDSRATTSDAGPGQEPHALRSDPVENQVSNGGRCPVETSPPGAGVAAYESNALRRNFTMIGRTRVVVPHTGTGSGIQLNARLYDVFPDGKAVMVDRGVRRVASANATTIFDLNGNGWLFPEGHRIRIELAQDDDPYMKQSTQPSSLTLSGMTLRIPVREATARVNATAAT
ncbi:MAG TPA: CocE/NonD family hydrolase C-terminal non-catalytic domain-containing protein [Actinomycetota bacterium]|nr:CocE/NonD family hydrolase C-terminal non-catalytic domain-containing protein [Actinomycetota bacterium]